MENTTPIISVKDLCFAYHGQRPVLENVELEIFPGQIITLLGPNGAGKSTLLNCIAGLNKPKSGSVLLDGRDIFSLTPGEIARRMAYVPQYSRLTYAYSVREYLVMGRAPYHGIFKRPDGEDYEIVQQVAQQLGIAHMLDKLCTQLSGGEMQMVNVCRAVAQQPALILFDEPTSALDYGNQLKVLRLVKNLSATGYAVLLTTHNPDHPFLLNSRVSVLDRNGVIRSGESETMLTQQLLSELYGEKMHIIRLSTLNRTACVSETL